MSNLLTNFGAKSLESPTELNNLFISADNESDYGAKSLFNYIDTTADYESKTHLKIIRISPPHLKCYDFMRIWHLSCYPFPFLFKGR